MSELDCTKDIIHNFSQYGYVSKEDAVWDLCAGQSEVVNFVMFYFSTLNENNVVFGIFLVFFLLLAFYLLSSTAEDYLEPPLTCLAKKLKFSDSLAGVTLVALANGGNDVFAAFAAGASQDEGILLPIGALFGAGCFVSTVVLAACILFSRGGSIQLNPKALIRDCAFYFLGGLWILVQGFIGQLTFVGAFGLFLIYFVFIVVVVRQEIKFRRQESLRSEEEDAIGTERKASFQVDVHHRGDEAGIGSLIKNQHIVHTPHEAEQVEAFGINSSVKEQVPPVRNYKVLKRADSHSNTVKVKWQYFVLRHKVWNELKELQEKSIVAQVFSIAVLPINIARNLTIPMCTEDRWNKKLAIIQPAFTALFCIWQFGYFDILQTIKGIIAFVLIVLAWTILIWKKSVSYQPPEGLGSLVLTVAAFLVAITWMNLVASILVDFINLLTLLSGLPSNYLGLTILAWGNSLNDLFVDSALARKGLGQVAVSGAIAGQYFNLSLGLGASLIRQVIAFGAREFKLLATDHVTIVNLLLISCLLVSLLSTLVYGYFSKFDLKKGYGIYLVSIYALCFITATLLIVVFPDRS